MRTLRSILVGGLLVGLAIAAVAIPLGGCGGAQTGDIAEKPPGEDEGQKASQEHMMKIMREAQKKKGR